MKWQELRGGFTMGTVAEGEALEVAMIEFCKQIQQRVIPQNEGVKWDHFRVEIWPDSGRMIAFPAHSSQRERIENGGCQVVFEDLLAQYEVLADSEMEDAAFTMALTDVERSWIDRFVDAAKSSGLSGLHIQFWDGDGESAIRVGTI